MTMTNTAAVRAMSGPVPRWAEWAAHAIPLCILPSSLWRIGAMFAPDDWYHGNDLTTGSVLYMVFLSVLSEGVGLLAFGLVRPWGEVVPRWIPLLGGRRVRPMAAVVPATFGTVAIFALYVYFFLNQYVLHLHVKPKIGTDSTAIIPSGGPALWILVAAYIPLLAWAPLLGALTVAYQRRRGAPPAARYGIHAAAHS
jgi:hypothetical protein